jgi:hypothetical protein
MEEGSRDTFMPIGVQTNKKRNLKKHNQNGHKKNAPLLKKSRPKSEAP